MKIQEKRYYDYIAFQNDNDDDDDDDDYDYNYTFGQEKYENMLEYTIFSDPPPPEQLPVMIQPFEEKMFLIKFANMQIRQDGKLKETSYDSQK